MSMQVFGLPVSRGVAIGRAVLVASSRVDVAHYFVEPEQVREEIQRLCAARELVCAELESLKNEVEGDTPAELVALLDVHVMLLNDEVQAAATCQWIEERHYNAEWAVTAQTEVLARQFRGIRADLLQSGMAQGLTEDAMRQVIEDPFYDGDLELYPVPIGHEVVGHFGLWRMCLLGVQKSVK